MRRAAAAFLLAAVVAGCQSGTPRSTASPDRPTPRSPSPSATPLLHGRPPPASALRDAQIAQKVRKVSAHIAFGGIVVASLPAGRQQVVFPTVTYQQAFDGSSVVHLKLPYFSCPADERVGAFPSGSCTHRDVVYADTDGRSATATLDASNRLELDVDAFGYRYGRGVDVAPGLTRTALGLRTHLRMVVLPGELLHRDGQTLSWRPLAQVLEVSPLASERVVTGKASQDDGYANRYEVVRRES